MMKNNDWLCLPIWCYGFYPKHIIEKAKKVKSKDEDLEDLAKEIAKNEGVEPGKFIHRWIPRDQMDILAWIQEDPEFPERSNMFFEDEEFFMVNLTHDKLMNKVHKFLLTEPTYREGIPETEVHYHVAPAMSQEERDEMEGDED